MSIESIAAAEARIYGLRTENTELTKKKANCKKVIEALKTDQGLLGNVKTKVSSASTSAGKITTGADNGKLAFSNGAFYVGQDAEGGNSQTFDNLNEENDNLLAAIQTALDTITTKITEVGENIKIATAASEEYESKITANNNKIEELQRYIEEERRKQEESSSSGDSSAAEAYEEARRNGWGSFSVN